MIKSAPTKWNKFKDYIDVASLMTYSSSINRVWAFAIRTQVTGRLLMPANDQKSKARFLQFWKLRRLSDQSIECWEDFSGQIAGLQTPTVLRERSS